MDKPTTAQMLEWTCKAHEHFPDDINIIYEIRSRLTEYDALKAEVEKWKAMPWTWKARAEKAEAALAYRQAKGGDDEK